MILLFHEQIIWIRRLRLCDEFALVFYTTIVYWQWRLDASNADNVVLHNIYV